jgi:hypothetical protein
MGGGREFGRDTRRSEVEKKHWPREFVANGVAVTPVSHGDHRSDRQRTGGEDLLTPRSYPHPRARIVTPAT